MAEAKSNHRSLYIVLGIALVIGILVTPVDAFSSQGVSFVETELKSAAKADRQYVSTKYPIGDAERLAEFPTKLGNWTMTHRYDWDFLAELLDTDVLLARDYRMPGVYVPVTLLIIQSTNMSSFHPAPVCYRAQGYTILDSETSTVEVPIDNATWAREGIMAGDGRAFDGSIEVKRLVVEKSRNNATQRELNLYFYIKEEQGGITTKVSWVRISMFVPATGDYSPHEKVLASFVAEVVPELFDPGVKVEQRTLLQKALGQ